MDTFYLVTAYQSRRNPMFQRHYMLVKLVNNYNSKSCPKIYDDAQWNDDTVHAVKIRRKSMMVLEEIRLRCK